MRAFLTVFLTLLPGVALAHPGHLLEAAGHNHILAGIAIGAAIGVAIWGALTGKHDEEPNEAEPDADGDEEPQEA